MPEMSTKYVPEHKGEELCSDKILKLAQRITDRIGHKVTTDDPEYWGLACVIDDEIADVALTMKVRKPYYFDELCVMNNIEPDGREQFQALLDKMARIGILEYDYGDKYTKDGPIPGTTYEPKDRRYWVPLFVPGSAEYTNMNLESLDKHPELAMFFERMTFLPLEKVTHLVPPGGAGIGMHVIPVQKEVDMCNEAISIEKISHWLEKYDGKYAASPCS
ncbi:MAG: pyridine nucleotide-disulfide oxidoreductase, partial [Lachnospiraceae bacterium]|nr:pyridine nucleotide-disulfide oxidoreductase [Lachnospiraceae bacterium]